MSNFPTFKQIVINRQNKDLRLEMFLPAIFSIGASVITISLATKLKSEY